MKANYVQIYATPVQRKNAKMIENEMNSKEPPGTARFGNFISYYNFHPPEERTGLVPFETLVHLSCSALEQQENLAMLDVGCNTGDLTRAIHRSIEKKSNRTCRTLAVDVDPILIQRAREANDLTGISYETADVMSPLFQTAVEHFLHQSGKLQFDISFLFSVTMWIHLNAGDLGLLTFLTDIASRSRILVVEPQPWKCYRAAARRLRRNNAKPFENFDKLKWRSDVESWIERILIKTCGFEKLIESQPTGWGRKLSIFFRSTSL